MKKHKIVSNIQSLVSFVKELFRHLYLSMTSVDFYSDVFRYYKGYGIKYLLGIATIGALIFCNQIFNNITRLNDATINDEVVFVESISKIEESSKKDEKIDAYIDRMHKTLQLIISPPSRESKIVISHESKDEFVKILEQMSTRFFAAMFFALVVAIFTLMKVQNQALLMCLIYITIHIMYKYNKIKKPAKVQQVIRVVMYSIGVSLLLQFIITTTSISFPEMLLYKKAINFVAWAIYSIPLYLMTLGISKALKYN